jgi:hypothetical protein
MEDFMKMFNAAIAFTLMSATLIFALAACEQGAGGGDGGPSIVYTSETADDKPVVLTITKKAEIPPVVSANMVGAPVFVYVPQSGDLYTIKIDRVVVSSGTVTVSANKLTLTFRPEGGGGSFTATLTATDGGTTSDGGTLTFKDGIRTSDGAVIAVQPATTTTPPYKDEPITIPSDTGDSGTSTYTPPRGGGGGGGNNGGGGSQPAIPAVPPPPAPPALLSTSVSYAPDGTASVTFTFDMGVTLTDNGGADVTGDGTATLTATPASQVAGTPITVSLTAANPNDGTKTITVEAQIMPVSRAFSRDSDTGTYTVGYCDSYGAAALVSGGAAEWVYFVKDSPEHRMFNAVYTPNAPESKGEASEAILGLFHITIGADAAADGIELSGTALPAGANIVIDIGIPNETSQLPSVYIPYRGLGADGGDYAHLRIRVNRGAELVILADNTGYIEGGAGYFKGGTVEVMGGGKLRDGAYEGLPLGEDTVIISRLGSYLAVGPDDTTNELFTGWLLGPQDARIQWDSGDQTAGYIEFHEGKMALAAIVTVRKTLGLQSNVWFVGGAKITVDIQEDNAVDGNRGIFANGGGFKFYGRKSAGGGENINPGNSIIEVKTDNYIDKRFFELGTSGDEVIPLYGQRTIKNKGTGTAAQWTGKIAAVNGYPDWEGTE